MVLRNIVQEYINSDHTQRTKIWHRLLSAIKLSLATVRENSGKRRRRLPLREPDDGERKEETLSDTRAIKRATRLVLDGCTSKAAKVLDQTFTPKQLTDEETLDKLAALHPQRQYEVSLPEDAPIISGIMTEELRKAGKRLAKGVNPGPTGMTDGIVQLMLDNEISCTNLAHMISDLINGFVDHSVLFRLNRARLVAIPKSNGGVRPVAMGEIFMSLPALYCSSAKNTLWALFLHHCNTAFRQRHDAKKSFIDCMSVLSLDTSFFPLTPKTPSTPRIGRISPNTYLLLVHYARFNGSFTLNTANPQSYCITDPMERYSESFPAHVVCGKVPRWNLYTTAPSCSHYWRF